MYPHRHLYLEPSSLIQPFMALQMEVFLGLFICPLYLRWKGGMDLSLFVIPLLGSHAWEQSLEMSLKDTLHHVLMHLLYTVQNTYRI